VVFLIVLFCLGFLVNWCFLVVMYFSVMGDLVMCGGWIIVFGLVVSFVLVSLLMFGG